MKRSLESLLLVPILVSHLIAPQAIGDGAAEAAPAPDVSARPPIDPDQLLPVDCLLPGKVRKLGSKITFLTPRRPQKTSAVDCEIRGGEYVAYDRADYKTALRIWLPAAEQGDARSQNYVGEIYGRGLGLEPDYGEAARWYEKSAEQGFAPAQINLAQLHEQGLAGPRDLKVAMNWYRRATKLEADNEPIVVASRHPEEMERLRKELAERDSELGELRQAIARLENDQATARSQRDTRESEIARGLDDITRTKRELAEAEDALETKRKSLASASNTRAERNAEREQELAALRAGINESQARLADVESAVETKRTELSSIDAQIQNLAAEETKRRKALAGLQKREEVELAGPTIQLIDPPLPLMAQRGETDIASRAEKRSVVGRIDAPAGLLTLTVNDAKISANEKGVFETQIEVPEPGVRVHILAIDKRGERAEVSFKLRPDIQVTKAPTPKRSRINFGNYYALLIANDEYTHLPDLETAHNDVNAIESVLTTQYGFKVTKLLDATRYQVLSAMEQMRMKLGEEDNLLIYYAGHGELDRKNQRGHWLPVDAERDSRANWISNVQLTDIMNSMNARHVLVVADSCYSGALTRSVSARLKSGMSDRARQSWRRKMVASRSRMALTSGGVKPVLDGGGGNHSIFANAFLDVLRRNNDVLEADRLAQEIQLLVTYAAEVARFDQTPQWAPIKYAGHEGGQFFFVPPAG